MLSVAADPWIEQLGLREGLHIPKFGQDTGCDSFPWLDRGTARLIVNVFPGIYALDRTFALTSILLILGFYVW